MAYRISTAAQNAACNSIVDLLDVGSGTSTGVLKLYSGTQPATPATTATGTLLATITLNNPAYGSSSSGSASLVTSPSVTAIISSSGTVGWGRFLDRDGTAIFDVSVTATGGGGDITFDSTTFTSGQTVTITAITNTVPM